MNQTVLHEPTGKFVFLAPTDRLIPQHHSHRYPNLLQSRLHIRQDCSLQIQTYGIYL
jgi:hypothetical protein